MNALIQFLNQAGDVLPGLVWPWVWQSSLLILLLWAVEVVVGRRVAPAIRYALWLLVPLKLLLPPTLALPTGIGTWGPRLWTTATRSETAPAAERVRAGGDWSVTLRDAASADRPPVGVRRAELTASGWWVAGWMAGSLGLLVGLGVRGWQLGRIVAGSAPASADTHLLLEEVRVRLGWRRRVRLGLVDDESSPALCGLFRPAILLPRRLVERLSREQLRAVLLHEAVHARRGDAWVHAIQALLQSVWWWHPLVWVANARLRAAREEAVDDAVTHALEEPAEGYALTLLEVAKAAVTPRVIRLGSVGIFESRSALRSRIERLLDDRRVVRPRLGALGLAMVALLGGVLLPMAEGPLPAAVKAGADIKARAPAAKSDRGVVTAVEVKDRTHRDGVESTGDAAAAPGLETRTFRMDYPLTVAALERRRGLALGDNWDGWVEALKREFRSAGVSLEPPNDLVFSLRTSGLTVRAPRQQIAAVQKTLDELGVSTPQIQIEARFYQVPEGVYRTLDFGAARRPTSGLTNAWVFAEERLSVWEKALSEGGCSPLAAPRVTTLSGREASIEQGSSTNDSTSYRLEVLAVALEQGMGLRVDTVAGVNEIMEVGAKGGRGKAPSGEPGLLYDLNAVGYFIRRFTNSVVLSDGQAVVVGDVGEELAKLRPRADKSGPKAVFPETMAMERAVIVVQAFLIDPAGNRIRAGAR